MDSENLAGPLKVAILIQAIEKEAAQVIIKSLNEDERKMLRIHLAQMEKISPELVEKVAQEFVSIASNENIRFKNEMLMALDEQDEREHFLKPIAKSSKLKALQYMETDHLAQLIKDEHPQTIAIILVHLLPEAASEVLAKMDDNKKADVAFRIAKLDKVKSGMIEEIDKVFEDVMKNFVTHKTGGGVDRLAAILNETDGSTVELILDEIEESDPELADQTRQLMYIFEDITLVDDKGLQKLLRRVEMTEMALALKGASEEVKEKVFKNLSERAGEVLKEEIQILGAVRMKEVEDAQQKITKMIQELEVKGEIIISGRRGEEVVV